MLKNTHLKWLSVSDILILVRFESYSRIYHEQVKEKQNYQTRIISKTSLFNTIAIFSFPTQQIKSLKIVKHFKISRKSRRK